MANEIQLKRSSVANKVPDAGNVLVGEPVVNLNDKIIFTKDTGGGIIIIGAGTTANVVENGNLYFTNARSRASVSAGTGISYDNTTGIITNTGSSFTTADARNSISLASGNVYGKGTYTAGTGVIQITAANVSVSANVPANPNVGDIWIDNATGLNFLFYYDGSSYQWVEQASSPLISSLVESVGGSTGIVSNVMIATALSGLDITVGNLIPTGNLIQNLGSSTNRFKDLYLANSTIFLGGLQLKDTDGSLTVTPTGGGSAVNFARSTDKLSTFAATSSNELAGVISDETGSGALVFATTPTLVTPVLGLATGTSVMLSGNIGAAAGNVSGNFTAGNFQTAGNVNSSSLQVTTASSLGTVQSGTWNGSSISTTYTDAKVTSVNSSTGAVTGLATTVGSLAQFGATTSAQLAGVISDETGSGALVFATSPTLVTPALGTPASGVMTNVTGLPLTSGVTGTLPVANGGTGVTGSTGTGSVVLSASPTFTGSISAANLTLSGDLIVNGTTTTISSTTLDITDKNITVAKGAANSAAADGAGITVDGASATFNYVDATTAWTSSQDINLATGKVHKISGTQVLSSSGLGSGILASNLTSVGTISSGTWNGSSISTTYTDAKVTSVNSSTGAVTGLATTAGTLAQFGATTSAQLAGVISDETGSGALVFATSPTLVTPALGTPSSGNLANCTFPTLNQNTTGSAATATDSTKVAKTGDTMSGPLNITGNGTYVGDAGYSTLILQDTSGYPGVNWRSGNSNWLQRMNAGGSTMNWFYSSNASGQGTGGHTEYLTLSPSLLQHSSSMRAPIFYDSDNTAYYTDPNSATISASFASSVNVATYNMAGLRVNASGTASTGGAIAIQQVTTEGWTGIYVDYEPYTEWGLWADNPNNYFSFTGGTGTGNIRSFTVPSRSSGNRTAYEKFRIEQDSGNTITGAISYANASSRAPIFYDSDNTAYYVDPASTSSLVGLTVANTISGSITGTAGGETLATVTGRGSSTTSTVNIGSGTMGFGQLNVQAGQGSVTTFRDIDIHGSWSAGEGHAITASHGSSSSNMVGQQVFQHDSPGSRIKWGRLYHSGDQSSYPMELISEGAAAYLQINSGSMRAPLFYDSGDTTYYGDFASTSNIYNLTIKGVVGDGTAPLQIAPVSSSGQYQWASTAISASLGAGHTMIHFIGNALSAGNSGYLGYNYTSAASGSNYVSLGHYANDNILRVYYGTYTQSLGSMRAPLFYDSDDTSYYVNPNGSSVLYSLVNYSTLDNYQVIGAGDNLRTGIISYDSTAMAADVGGQILLGYKYTSAGNYTQGAIIKMYKLNATSDDYSSGLKFQVRDSGENLATQVVIDPSGNLYSYQSMRSPIFYDYNDTAYYTDPAGTSNLSAFSNATKARSGLSVFTTDRWTAASGAANYLVGSQGYSNNYTWDSAFVNLGSCFMDHWGSGTGHPQGSGYVHAQGLQALHYRDGSTAYGWQLVSGGDTNPRMWTRKVWGSGINSWYELALRDYNVGGALYSNIYYDSDNTSYYVDVSGTSILSDLQITGVGHKYLYINPGNGYEAMVRYNGGSGSSWYVGKRMTSQRVGTESFHFYSEAAGSTVGGIDTSGNLIMGGSVDSYSDITLKENIEVISNALQKVQAIRGVTFTRNDQDDKIKRHSGIIAQEVELVLPEVVREDASGIKSVAYGNMVGLLIEAIKEQQIQIEDLKKEMQAIKNKISL